jgi:hypothetical protein
VKTWYGKIGVEFNTKGKSWSIVQYKKFIRCLASCYSDPLDVKKLRCISRFLSQSSLTLSSTDCRILNPYGLRFQTHQHSDLFSAACLVVQCPLSLVHDRHLIIFKEVAVDHLDRLKPGKWLNDSLVFSGMK